jgi:hypothetical protein
MADPVLADNGITRRGFLRRGSLVALGSVAAVMGAPAVAASARRLSGGTPRAKDVPACAQFCSPASNCGNAGCGSGMGLFHCVGCGKDFYHCYAHSCSSGFCRLPDC